MHDFTTALKKKGYTGKELAERWGITPRSLSRIAANPSRRDWDALAGLPAKPLIVAADMQKNGLVFSSENFNPQKPNPASIKGD